MPDELRTPPQPFASLNRGAPVASRRRPKDAFAVFDGHHRLAVCDDGYEELFGGSLGGLIGSSFEDVVVASSRYFEFASDAERSQFRSARLARAGESTNTHDLRGRDGRRWRLVDRPLRAGGFVDTLSDVTEFSGAIDALREETAAADAANKAKSEFLSSMSHELRTPLNAILGFTQLMQRDKLEPLSARHKGRLEQILSGGNHLLRLVDDILDLSRIEAGGVTMSQEPVNVRDVLSEVASMLEPAAAREQVRVEIEPIPEGVPPVSVDRTRFLQILMNLGSNGVKYNRQGGKVTFAVSMTDPARVRVTVTDTGLGIPLDQQTSLFRPFQRAGQERGAIPGTGLGLVVTRRLAELMRGSVGFHSVPSEGSTFWVDVRATRMGGPSSRPPSSASRELGYHFKGTVIYVEDNPASVKLVADLFDGFPRIEFASARSAEAGIELARKLRPDAIIMDVNLPGMSGIEALRALRESSETANTPVVALTAAATDGEQLKGRQAGFYRYLTKPIKLDELLVALEELFPIDEE